MNLDDINPLVAILASRQFRAAYWMVSTKTLVMGGTLLTQIFCFINDRGIMYHSPYMWKYCSETTPFGPHIDWYGLTSGKSGILTYYDQRDAHVLKWNHEKINIRAARDWDIPFQNCFDAIYPSVAILASRHFWMAHSLITTKTLVVGGTLLTKSFRLCNDQEIMYHSPYMWKSCSEPTPYGTHMRGVSSV